MLRQKRFKARGSRRRTSDYAHVCNVEKQLFERGQAQLQEVQGARRRTQVQDAGARRAASARATSRRSTSATRIADALREAERCIQCAKPTCIAGCPVSIDIPRFIRHLLVRDLDGALGGHQRVEPVPVGLRPRLPAGDRSARRSASSAKSRSSKPVAIGRLERFVGDNARAAQGRAAARSSARSARSPSSAPARPAWRSPPTWCATAATSPSTRRCTWSAACCATASRRSACRATSSTARSQHLKDMGVQVRDQQGDRQDLLRSPQLMGEMGYDAVFVGVGAGAPSFLGIPGEFAGQVYSANEFLTRVNLMGGDRFPYLDTPVTLGQERGRDRRRQHRDGLPARRQAPGRADGALRLPPHRGRGAGPHRGAAPRQGGGHRVLLPARAGRDPAPTPTATCAA